jgi:hypothetical protein
MAESLLVTIVIDIPTRMPENPDAHSGPDTVRASFAEIYSLGSFVYLNRCIGIFIDISPGREPAYQAGFSDGAIQSATPSL